MVRGVLTLVSLRGALRSLDADGISHRFAGQVVALEDSLGVLIHRDYGES
jgi:hypothetical protein